MKVKDEPENHFLDLTEDDLLAILSGINILKWENEGSRRQLTKREKIEEDEEDTDFWKRFGKYLDKVEKIIEEHLVLDEDLDDIWDKKETVKCRCRYRIIHDIHEDNDI